MEVLIGLSEINYSLYETDHPIYGYANYGNGQDDVNYTRPNVSQVELVNFQSSQE